MGQTRLQVRGLPRRQRSVYPSSLELGLASQVLASAGHVSPPARTRRQSGARAARARSLLAWKRTKMPLYNLPKSSSGPGLSLATWPRWRALAGSICCAGCRDGALSCGTSAAAAAAVAACKTAGCQQSVSQQVQHAICVRCGLPASANAMAPLTPASVQP